MPARYPNLLDFANAMAPDGSIAAVAEILNQTNEALADWHFREGNLVTGHRFGMRTALPSVTWRTYYGGVQPDKSGRTQVTVSCGMMAAYHEVDKDEADINGNSNEFRMSEAKAQLESFAQTMAETLFYGDQTADPEQITGFAPHYDDLSADNADNIIDAGGLGSDNGSIYLVNWAPDTVFGIVPKGSTAGIQVQDKGQVTVENAPDGNGRYEAYRMYFCVKVGLCIQDWRHVVRICNIDRSLLTGDISTGADLPDLMSDAIERLPSGYSGNTVFYMDRSIRQMWRKQMANKLKQSTLTEEQIGGVKSPTFDGIPIRRVDVLSVDEARVV